MYKKSHFGGQFEKKHGKRAQTLIDQCEGNKIGKVSLSSMQNLGTVCEDIECLPQVLSS